MSVLAIFGVTIYSPKAFSQGLNTVDIAIAKAVATNYCLNTESKYAEASANDLTFSLVETKIAGNNVLYYVFNINKEDGYIIISADRNSPPVLCYIPEGSFDLDFQNRDPSFNDWLEAFAIQIENSILEKTINKPWQNLWNSYTSKGKLDTEIMQLNLTTQWNQGYNRYAPVSQAGCVAVAMAQIINYYQWPINGIGDHNYPDLPNGPAWPERFYCTGYEAPYTPPGGGNFYFNNHTGIYDYAKMKLNDIFEVSRLMYNIAVSVDMDWVSCGSWAHTPTVVAPSFKTYFNYSQDAEYVWMDGYSDNNWDSLLIKQIRKERPVLYRGLQSTTGWSGHAWVCLGYKTIEGSRPQFYFNMGNGNAPGYYTLLNTGFPYEQGAVINIFPPSQPDLTITSPSVSKNPINSGETVTLSFSIKNNGVRDAVASTAACYLSTDQILDKDDIILITSLSFPELTIGETDGKSQDIVINAEISGTYYILIEADTEHYVHESLENNNIYSLQITIQGTVPSYPYRSRQNGNWNDPTTWEYNDGSGWKSATSYPSRSSGVITILTGHTVTLSGSLTLDEVTIASGGQVNVSSGVTMTIYNGSEDVDFNVTGKLYNEGIVEGAGTLVFNSGSTYEHARNGGSIPIANWDPASICLITKITNNSLNGFGQSFGNFTWNCSSQSGTVAMNDNVTIEGNFTLISTGTGKLAVTNDNNSRVLTISGNYSQTGGTLDFSSGPSGAAAYLYIAGNLTHAAAARTITTGGQGATNGTIVFNGSEPQILSFTNADGSEWVSYTLNSGSNVSLGSDLALSGWSSEPKYYADVTVNGILNAGIYVIRETSASASHFYLNSGATIITANTNTTGALTSSGANGSIQVTGSRTYSPGANYVYNGTVQVTGTGLPTTAITGNITVEAGASVITTNSIIESGTMTVNGTLTPGTATQTMSGSGALTGTGTVKVNRTTAPADFSTQYTIANKELSELTVEYSVLTGAQVVSPLTYCNLKLDNTSGENTLGGDVTVTGTITTTSGGTIKVAASQLLTATTISNAGIFTIAPSGQTTATNITNNGTLNLNSDNSGIASLLVEDDSPVTGTNNIQLYLTGGGAPNAYMWHYISSPVAIPNITTVFGANTTDLARYDESLAVNSQDQGWVAADGWIYYKDTSVPTGTGFSTLDLGKGYAYYYQDNERYTISGTINTGNVTINPLAFSGHSTSGFNLIGNPFTCTLDWDEVASFNSLPKANLSSTIYSTKDYILFPTYTPGGPNPGPDGGTNTIPPMQAFFVDASSAGQTITLPATAKIHSNMPRFKGDSDSKEISFVRLLIEDDNISRDALVWFDEKATSSFDSGFDAYKLGKSLGSVNIWTKTGDIDQSIIGIPFPEKPVEITVAIHAENAGTYILSSKELKGLENYRVTLKDKTTNTIVDLKKGDKLLFSTLAGEFEDRFVLTVCNLTTGSEEIKLPENQFNIYAINGILNINPLSDEWNGKQGSVRIADLMGKSIFDNRNVEFWKNTVIQLPVQGVKGIYFVEIRSGVMRYVGKVMIK